MDPPRGVEKRKGTSIRKYGINEFGDGNNFETGPKWAKFGPNIFRMP